MTDKHHINQPLVSTLWLLLIIAGCAEGVNFDDTDGGTLAKDGGIRIPQLMPDMGPSQPPVPIPNDDRCLPFDIADLEPCCEEDEAHCVPAGDIPAGFQTLVGACPGGLCVPDKILDARGEIALEVCQSIGGPGRCLSVCIPQVAEQAALLPPDICDEGEKCVPCINPLDGMETGVCGVISCDPNQMMTDPSTMPMQPPMMAYSCDNQPSEPILDPSSFPPCCDGAHCVPIATVPPEQRADLGTCNGDLGACVPDKFIESGGFYTPMTCNASGNLEGRCMSTCLPQIASQLDFLAQGICDPNERCVPCCDPRTGMASGVCGRACDGPPATPCQPPLRCCAGHGTCLAPGLVPGDQQDSLKDCGSQGAEDLLCVPNEFLDPDWVPQRCNGQPLLGGDRYDGVCLPDCLRIPFEFALDASVCPGPFVCAPCRGPFGGSTGAPGCD